MDLQQFAALKAEHPQLEEHFASERKRFCEQAECSEEGWVCFVCVTQAVLLQRLCSSTIGSALAGRKLYTKKNIASFTNKRTEETFVRRFQRQHFVELRVFIAWKIKDDEGMKGIDPAKMEFAHMVQYIESLNQEIRSSGHGQPIQLIADKGQHGVCDYNV